ncbi:unnamed protein product, partial [Mesorhabditis belari]|uniref:Uncharacterized protein n=1 Tax=Mesorhabditis belari TaxID=2138241 RepID=A0AAF3E926_9BILA
MLWFFNSDEKLDALASTSRTLLEEAESIDVRTLNVDDREKQFHDAVREHIICLLLFLGLYLFSYWLLAKFKQRNVLDALFAGEEDYFVYRISLWMCTVSLAVSIGSTVLMPFSLIGAELLQRYPGNFYLQWLSWSLIHSLWNYVFVLANLSLFILLPFSYLFLESQGFSNKTKGILSRLYETLAVCTLFIVMLLCLCDLIYYLLVASSENLSFLSLFSIFSITSVNLPLLYSCVSLFGVMLLLALTPYGFSRMFTIVFEKAQTKPPNPDADDDILIEKLEMFYQARNLTEPSAILKSSSLSNCSTLRHIQNPSLRNKSTSSDKLTFTTYLSSGDAPEFGLASTEAITSQRQPHNVQDFPFAKPENAFSYYYNRATKSMLALSYELPLREKTIRWYQRIAHAIKYPLCVFGLVVLTTIAFLMVLINILKLSFGFRALPVYVQYMEVQNRHTFGLLGVIIEVITIFYVMTTSLVGFYSLPIMSSIRPKKDHTSMTAIIINCSALVILSSALPVLAVTLGITSFDLLGAFGSLRWLSSFYLVVGYNCLFAGATVLILCKQFTSHVFKELAKKLFFCGGRRFGEEKAATKLE